MRKEGMISGILLYVGIMFTFVQSVSGMNIVSQGKPTAIIITGKNPGFAEEYAAKELAKYIEKMTGTRLPQSKTLPRKVKNLILIGTPQTNKEIARLIQEGLIELSKESLGEEGFIIKTLKNKKNNLLVLGGTSGKAVLYAVYHLLGEILGVGFFWEGEYIPKKENIFIENLSLREKPFFPYREYLQGCSSNYSTNYWDLEDWKREVNWMAKNKLNYFMPPIAPLKRSRVLRPSALVVRKPIIKYANLLGIRAEGPENNIYQLHPAPEKKWKINREKMREWAVRIGQRTAASMKANPEKEVHMSGWAQVADPFYWTPETVEAFFKPLSPVKKRFLVWDLWADANPMYKRYNSWFGFPFALGILHSMGNMNQLTGNIWYLSERAKEVARDPKYKNCVGIAIQPEHIHHNPLYFHYAASLGWNPFLSVEEFIRSYARRRYGENSSYNMSLALKELTHSVYTISGWPTPTYQIRLRADENFLNEDEIQQAFQRMTRGVYFIPHLRKALEYALKEKDNQKYNLLYLNDLADISRAYLREICDYYIFQVISSYIRKDKASFIRNLYILKTALNYMKEVLGSRPYFWMSREIDKAIEFKKKYEDRVNMYLEKEVNIETLGGIYIPAGKLSDEDLSRIIRTFFKMDLGWKGYRRTDRYEIFKMVYQKQEEAFLQLLSKSFGSSWSPTLNREYREKIKEIFSYWRDTGWIEREMWERNLNIIDVAQRINKDLGERINETSLIHYALKRENVGNFGFREDFSRIGTLSLWKEKNPPEGEIVPAERGLILRSYTRNYAIIRKISIPLKKFPVLAFKFIPYLGRKPDIYIHWIDSKGIQRRTRVYGAGGADANWVNPQEIYLDIEKILSLISEPERITGIEIKHDWAPARKETRYVESKLKWIGLASKK